jgi:hypothetical protein
MFGPVDLRSVQRHQETLRREADQRRLAAAFNAKEPRPDRARRALRIRLSFAA